MDTWSASTAIKVSGGDPRPIIMKGYSYKKQKTHRQSPSDKNKSKKPKKASKSSKQANQAKQANKRK
jgi:hypothetical protein